MTNTGKTDIYVYADWQGLNGTILIGILGAQQAKAGSHLALNMTMPG